MPNKNALAASNQGANFMLTQQIAEITALTILIGISKIKMNGRDIYSRNQFTKTAIAPQCLDYTIHKSTLWLSIWVTASSCPRVDHL